MQQRTRDARLARLTRLSPTAAFLITLAAVVAALLVPGVVGGLLLLLLAAGAAWLTASTWPVQPVPVRVMRVAILGLLVAIAIAKLLG